MRTKSHDDEHGAVAVEYALMIVLVAVVIFTTVTLLGFSVRDLFGDVDLLNALN